MLEYQKNIKGETEHGVCVPSAGPGLYQGPSISETPRRMLSGLQLVLAICLEEDHRTFTLRGRCEKPKPHGPLVLQETVAFIVSHGASKVSKPGETAAWPNAQCPAGRGRIMTHDVEDAYAQTLQ